MKKIPLKTITFPARGSVAGGEVFYTDVLKEVLFSGGKEGMSTGKMVAAMEVWAPIKAAIGKEFVLLEEAEYRQLLQQLNVFLWASGSEEVMTFISDVQNAETFIVSTE